MVASKMILSAGAAFAKTRLLVNCFWPSSQSARSDALPD